jgi:hypothetical protein
MNAHFILKRYDPQVPPFKLGNLSPEAKAVIFLRLRPDRIFEDPNAPLLFQVRALAENLFFKVLRKLIGRHERKDTLANARGKRRRITESVRAADKLLVISTSNPKPAQWNGTDLAALTMARVRRRLVLCLKNEGYAVSLERRNIYMALSDERAAKHDLLRVIDESGGDYLSSTAHAAGRAI